MLYEIIVDGCDDSTSIELELTESEFTLVEGIAHLITKASTYGCMPRMYVAAADKESNHAD